MRMGHVFRAATWAALAITTGWSSARSAAPDSSAAPPDSSVLTLPPVEIHGRREAEDPELRQWPGFARAYDVSRAYGRLRMVSDLLSGAVGVHVRQLGGVGSFSSISIRGAPSSQVAVYLDGVPLNSAQYGVVDPADLPIEALSRIEVYRGPAPSGFDSPGGGVIHLVTRQDEGAWSRFSFGRGSYGTAKADFAAGWRGPRSAALLVAQGLRSDGAFRYLDDNGTPYNGADDSIAVRRNNGSGSLSLTARAEQQAGPVRFSLTHDQLALRRGVPGTGADPALHSSYRADRAITNLLVGWQREAESAPDHSLRLYATRQRDRFADPLGELTGLRQQNDDHTRARGGQLQTTARLPLAAALRGDFEGRAERYEPSLVLPAPRGLTASSRRTWRGGLELRDAPWRDRLELSAAVRRQSTADDFGGGPPYPGALPVPPLRRRTNQNGWSAGLRVGPPALALKSTVAALARMPTLEELFGDRGGIYGNPGAKPERVLTRDVGLVSFWSAGGRRLVQPAWLESQLSAYRSEARDLLVFVQNSQRSSVAQNVSAARLEGLELGARAGWGAGLLAELSWTRSWTRDEGEAVYWRGKELPGRPRDEGLLRLGLRRARWSASYEFHYVSRNFLDRYNALPVGPRSLHDVSLGAVPWPWSPEWTAECRNLTDQRVEDFAGFPLPGRTFYAGFRARLERKEQPVDPLP